MVSVKRAGGGGIRDTIEIAVSIILGQFNVLVEEQHQHVGCVTKVKRCHVTLQVGFDIVRLQIYDCTNDRHLAKFYTIFWGGHFLCDKNWRF